MMSMHTTTTVVTATVITAESPIASNALAHACGADLNWVIELVEQGIVRQEAAQTPPGDWCFDSADLQCALEARRLERDLGVGLDAAALILELRREVRRLKAELRVRGR
jgi:chaperone modulatory protein CbpM